MMRTPAQVVVDQSLQLELKHDPFVVHVRQQASSSRARQAPPVGPHHGLWRARAIDTTFCTDCCRCIIQLLVKCHIDIERTTALFFRIVEKECLLEFFSSVRRCFFHQVQTISCDALDADWFKQRRNEQVRQVNLGA